MFELSPTTAAQYLARMPGSPPQSGDLWRVRELGGGVSNTVLLCERGGERLVLKQSLDKLRVEEDWFADRYRIHRECDAMRSLAPHLPRLAVPDVIFEDRDNCIYAMRASPESAVSWKHLLLAGEVYLRTAEAAGRILSAQISATHNAEAWRVAFGDQTCFDQLRLDPYYRFTAGRHPDLARFFENRIASCSRNACALVHGDFSPKNLLVEHDAVTAIDFEVVHYGDPSFDSAFLLNHLVLKSIHRPQWTARYRSAANAFWSALAAGVPADLYGNGDSFEQSMIAHLGCLLLARADGKSPAEYLSSEGKQTARLVARSILTDPPGSIDEAFHRISCH
jgi:aminoglycoside phosphotransferase (APT) family kinase protein